MTARQAQSLSTTEHLAEGGAPSAAHRAGGDESVFPTTVVPSPVAHPDDDDCDCPVVEVVAEEVIPAENKRHDEAHQERGQRSTLLESQEAIQVRGQQGGVVLSVVVDAENEQNCTLASPRQSKQEGKLPFEQQHNDEECTVSVVAEELYLSEDMRRKGEEGRDHTRETYSCNETCEVVVAGKVELEEPSLSELAHATERAVSRQVDMLQEEKVQRSTLGIQETTRKRGQGSLASPRQSENESHRKKEQQRSDDSNAVPVVVFDEDVTRNERNVYTRKTDNDVDKVDALNGQIEPGESLSPKHAHTADTCPLENSGNTRQVAQGVTETRAEDAVESLAPLVGLSKGSVDNSVGQQDLYLNCRYVAEAVPVDELRFPERAQQLPVEMPTDVASLEFANGINPDKADFLSQMQAGNEHAEKLIQALRDHLNALNQAHTLKLKNISEKSMHAVAALEKRILRAEVRMDPARCLELTEMIKVGKSKSEAAAKEASDSHLATKIRVRAYFNKKATAAFLLQTAKEELREATENFEDQKALRIAALDFQIYEMGAGINSAMSNKNYAHAKRLKDEKVALERIRGAAVLMTDPDGTAYMADLLNLRQVVEQRTKDFKSMPNNFKDFDAAEKRDQKLQAAAEDAEVHGRCPKRKTRTYFFFGKRVEVCNHVFCSGGSLLCGFGVCCKCDPKEHVSPSNAPFFFFLVSNALVL